MWLISTNQSEIVFKKKKKMVGWLMKTNKAVYVSSMKVSHKHIWNIDITFSFDLIYMMYLKIIIINDNWVLEIYLPISLNHTSFANYPFLRLLKNITENIWLDCIVSYHRKQCKAYRNEN